MTGNKNSPALHSGITPSQKIEATKPITYLATIWHQQKLTTTASSKVGKLKRS